MLNIKRRVKEKAIRIKLENMTNKIKKQLKTHDFTVISQNCIGGVFYHDMGLKFLSPTIDLYIPEPDFIKFISNLEYYINTDLEISDGENYPIGLLGGDINIHFMHYTTCSEARDAWYRRKMRINWNKMIILSTDRDGFNDEIFEQWKKIKYPKVLFTSNEKYVREEDSVFYPQYASNGFVPDLIPKREFYKDNKLLNIINSMNK